jgi:ferric-dicitrate binding protein FerR (iron transport regulator)
MDKNKNIEQQETEFFDKVELPYSKTKEEVWKSMEALLDESPSETSLAKPAGRIISMRFIRMCAAAAIALLIVFTLFARFYTVSFETAPGATASRILPDGSMVDLNAQSSIQYAPYWWRFDRHVDLSGEAFFQVEKGKAFTVASIQGSTQVLGTSFNIFARAEVYEVYCATGKVKVKDRSGKEIILTPGEFAGLSDLEPLGKTKEASEESILSWKTGSFIYNTTPLSKVFKDVARQYDIALDLAIDGIDSLSYTGKFERGESAEEALEIICFSFNLAFVKTDGNRYSIRGN